MRKVRCPSRQFWALLVACAALLAACAPQSQLTPSPTVSASPTLPPATPSPAPSRTPAPTATPSPSATAEPVHASTEALPALTPLAQLQVGLGQPGQGGFLENAELLVLAGSPAPAELVLSGTFPNPCYQLQVEVAPPDAQNQIDVAAQAISDPQAACIQVLEPFVERVPLGTFSAGTYQVFLNGQLVGEFTV